MTIREMIEKLEAVEKEYGNVKVENFYQDYRDKADNVPMTIKVRVEGEEKPFGGTYKETYVDIM